MSQLETEVEVLPDLSRARWTSLLRQVTIGIHDEDANCCVDPESRSMRRTGQVHLSQRGVQRLTVNRLRSIWRCVQQKIIPIALCVSGVALLMLADSDRCLAQSNDVNFSRDVLPILSRACFQCHGLDETSRQANLRLDERQHALRLDDPVVIAGNAKSSRVFQRIISQDPNERMPPVEAKQQLTPSEIELLRRWIDEGASWGEHWSFQPIKRTPAPVVSNLAWSLDAIDDFILSRLEAMELSPSGPADDVTLLRRLTLDLIGLPPTPGERDDFLSDASPDACERLIDRLMASPHYGERWGRHWLDAARYADSAGFEGDPPRNVWKYRDWVINAINADLPFDEFVVRQLAGHLLPGSTEDDRIATGFLLNSQQDGGSEPSRLDAVVDRVNTLGTVFLGLTVGCAQCHSHKFDPVSQREYYQLFAFVNSADEFKLEFGTQDQLTRRDALAAQLESLIEERKKYSANLSTEKQKIDPGYLERTATIDQLKSRIPEFVSALVLRPAQPERTTTTFVRGEFAQPGEPVVPGVPRVLPAMCQNLDRSHSPSQSTPPKPTLLEFARWLVSTEQPLTPRVTINRVWQQLFGKGLVATENDFGTQGARPTHPELLDWIASEFSSRGWRSKELVRRLVRSATYRQSSARRDELDRIDADNQFLGRQTRLRLEAEIVRDVALAAGGLLSNKLHGPSVFPFQHDGLMINRATPASWNLSPGEDRYRRGLYTFYWRLTPHPQLQTFDAPDAITACTRRMPSNTPLQALALLNEPTFVEASDALAKELLRRSDMTDEARIANAFEICLGRTPVAEELSLLLDLLRESRNRSTANNGSNDDADSGAWKQLTRTIMNLDEFIMRE